MRKVRILAKATAWLLPLLLAGAASAADDACTARAEAFLSQLAAGNAVAALDDLYATNPWILASQDDIISLKTQMAGLESILGDYHRYVRLAEKRVADCWVYLSYLVLYDRQPLRFEFQFYRPGEEWMTYSFSYDDDLDEDVVAEARREVLAAGR